MVYIEYTPHLAVDMYMLWCVCVSTAYCVYPDLAVGTVCIYCGVCTVCIQFVLFF